MKNKAMAVLAAMVLLFGGFTGGFFLGRNTRVETIQTTKTVHETVPGETVVVLREVLVTLPPETVMPTVPSTEPPVRSEPVKQTEPKKSSDSPEKKGTFPVNINTASKKELDALPGIGEVLAQLIIDYRSANGPFSTVDELTKVKGIGAKTLEKLKPYATV